MAVEKPYATFDYYENTYKGTALDASEFPYFIRFASYLIDDVTSGRVLNLPELTDTVRDAACAVAEKYHGHKTRAANDVKSESNDGYSVSYADVKTEDTVKDEAAALIRMYLSGTGLLYRGVFEEPPDD